LRSEASDFVQQFVPQRGRKPSLATVAAAGEEVSRAAHWLFVFAVLTAVVTLLLIAVGGLVTSHEAGMAVPDWPNSYGYNMFLFPPARWVGGILYEHTHRLIATIVGVLVVALTRWLGGSGSRLPLAIVGGLEVIAGIIFLACWPQLKGAGHFLWGIGGVVLMAAAVWVRDLPAARPLPALGWVAFAAVQIQGLLGGLRVVLINDSIGIFHATLAQMFFALLCAIAVLAGVNWWRALPESSSNLKSPISTLYSRVWTPVTVAALAITILILGQLVLGATMRHQHAGLAIPDFPQAYGKLWPAMDEASVIGYNAHRIETTTVNPITGFQVGLQMAHRIGALVILLSVAGFAWTGFRRFQAGAIRKLAATWLGLVLLQGLLGATTIWMNKPADIATAHVVLGALLLAFGAMMCIILPNAAESTTRMRATTRTMESVVPSATPVFR
jgi:cytochrome c oxidase assembly protein subunit 15